MVGGLSRRLNHPSESALAYGTTGNAAVNAEIVQSNDRELQFQCCENLTTPRCFAFGKQKYFTLIKNTRDWRCMWL
jgi:hypothetical protein